MRHLPTSTFTLSFTDVSPSPPTDFAFISEDYKTNFSSASLSWNSPDDPTQLQVDYYELQVHIQVELEERVIITYNYSKSATMATVTNLPSNVNITFLLTAHNCVGESVAVKLQHEFGEQR